jgi:integrase
MQTPIPFRTFIGKATIKLLKTYFATLPEPLAPKDLIFNISERNVQKRFVAVSKHLYGKYEFRNPAGTHSLRTIFRTFMVDAGCPESYVEYWMGHRLNSDLAKTYTAKSDDSFRESYRKVEKAVHFSLVSD